MKQYTTPEQTAKLIELGFEKPSSIASVEPICGMGGISVAKAYTIGELIEMLPTKLIVDDVSCSRVTEENEVLYYNIAIDSVGYWCDDNTDLIDNLYDMVVKLKEEGVI